MLPGSHFDKKQKQAQQFSQYLRKYSFPRNYINSRAYMSI